MHLFSVEENLPLIAAGLADHIHTEKDLHQCALARAVFSAQAEHIARLQREIDIAQDLVAEKVLLDIAHFQ